MTAWQLMSEGGCLQSNAANKELTRNHRQYDSGEVIPRTLPSREKRRVAVLLAVRPWVFCMVKGLLAGAGSCK